MRRIVAVGILCSIALAVSPIGASARELREQTIEAKLRLVKPGTVVRLSLLHGENLQGWFIGVAQPDVTIATGAPLKNVAVPIADVTKVQPRHGFARKFGHALAIGFGFVVIGTVCLVTLGHCSVCRSGW